MHFSFSLYYLPTAKQLKSNIYLFLTLNLTSDQHSSGVSWWNIRDSTKWFDRTWIIPWCCRIYIHCAFILLEKVRIILFWSVCHYSIIRSFDLLTCNVIRRISELITLLEQIEVSLLLNLFCLAGYTIQPTFLFYSDLHNHSPSLPFRFCRERFAPKSAREAMTPPVKPKRKKKRKRAPSTPLVCGVKIKTVTGNNGQFLHKSVPQSKNTVCAFHRTYKLLSFTLEDTWRN